MNDISSLGTFGHKKSWETSGSKRALSSPKDQLGINASPLGQHKIVKCYCAYQLRGYIMLLLPGRP